MERWAKTVNAAKSVQQQQLQAVIELERNEAVSSATTSFTYSDPTPSLSAIMRTGVPLASALQKVGIYMLGVGQPLYSKSSDQQTTIPSTRLSYNYSGPLLIQKVWDQYLFRLVNALQNNIKMGVRISEGPLYVVFLIFRLMTSLH